jgi:hypothetical protein
MDYDLENENKGSSKGPFYGAAAFIFITIAIFASFSLQEQGTLNHWQIATFLLGSGLIAVLIFLPHFLAGIAEKLDHSSSQEESALANKTFFELKEMRSELDALAVKIDKVPTLVDKIISESKISGSEEPQNSILDRLQDLEAKLSLKIEEGYAVPPLLPEPDQEKEEIKKSIDLLTKEIRLLQKKFNFSPEDAPTIISKESAELQDKSSGGNINEEETQDYTDGQTQDDGIPLKPNDHLEETDSGKEEEHSLSPNDSDTSSDLSDELIKESIEGVHEENIPIVDEDNSEADHQPENSNDTPPLQTSKTEEIVENADETVEELDLGLPAPEETLRKVDALLSGQQSSDDSKIEEKEGPKNGKNGTTTVVANVMIGIGNKPFLRGEGPGLNWDEGVSMNFVEIGKWAWSPPRKNASLIVQVYRNDQDPDKGGKIEVKPGQKLEITPDFS